MSLEGGKEVTDQNTIKDSDSYDVIELTKKRKVGDGECLSQSYIVVLLKITS